VGASHEKKKKNWLKKKTQERGNVSRVGLNRGRNKKEGKRQPTTEEKGTHKGEIHKKE